MALVGYFAQISLAGRDGFGEIAVRELLARFGIRRVHGVVLGAHFVVETLIAGTTLAIDGIGSLAGRVRAPRPAWRERC